MNCPACNSPLKSHVTAKGAEFLTCSKWPACGISGTPELLKRFEPVPMVPPEPVRLGEFITGLAQLRILQAKLKAAKTKEERVAIRKQALEAMK